MFQNPADTAASCYCKDSHRFRQKIIFPNCKHCPCKPQKQIAEQHLGLCITVPFQKFPFFFPEVSSERCRNHRPKDPCLRIPQKDPAECHDCRQPSKRIAEKVSALIGDHTWQDIAISNLRDCIDIFIRKPPFGLEYHRQKTDKDKNADIFHDDP